MSQRIEEELCPVPGNRCTQIFERGCRIQCKGFDCRFMLCKQLPAHLDAAICLFELAMFCLSEYR